MVRVDIPQLGVDGAVMCVIGALGESFGFLLFPSLDGYDAFARAADADRDQRGSRDLGTTWISLDFEHGGDLPPPMRREVAQHGWDVAGPQAYPTIRHHDRDGMPRPLTEHDVQVVAACAGAFTAFFARHGDRFGHEGQQPIGESMTNDEDVTVRFTLPYEAWPAFADEAAIHEATARAPVPALGPSSSLPAGKTSRNAPCPCGSGDKYKKCCLPADEARRIADDPALLHETDARLVRELHRFAARRFGQAWLRAAADDFEDCDAALQLFGPWSLYCFRVGERPVAEWFAEDRRRALPPADLAWLGAQRRAWLSIWEVVAVEPGRSVTVRDQLTGEERLVREVSGSKVLVKRDSLLGRVIDHDTLSVFCGIHPRTLPPPEAAEVVRLARGKLRKRTAIPAERLRDEAIGRYLISRWEKEVAAFDRRRLTPPRLQNTDGEALLFTTDHFAFAPADRAAVEAKLGKMAGVGHPEPDGRERRFTFLREGNAMNAGLQNTVLGSVRVSADSLALEANSVARGDALRKRLEQACGRLVCHVLREHSDPMALAGKGGKAKPRRSADDSPEAQQLLREVKARHYAAWLDQPVPALDARTPREAARTKRGREKVDLLLKDMENHESRLPVGLRFDFSGIRTALRLDE